ncbi:MAG: PEP-CTERM sorting domain-containing protein [Gammaproteobacteria bacterium]|nr:PEP-CTERM sorting domain-containing protein [Gammaproteobacteria bacterium]
MKFLTSASLFSMLIVAQSAFAQVDPGTGSKMPEPGVWALMGIGVVALIARRFTKR